MHVSTASSWGFASPPNNKCMSSAGGRPSTATATFFLNIPTYVPCLSIVPVRDNENNHNLFVFAQVCFCLPNNGSGLRDWSLGVELWALSNALWHLALSTGSGDSALGVGHCALGIVGLPTADSKRERKRPAAKSLESQSGERRPNINLFLLCSSLVMISL